MTDLQLDHIEHADALTYLRSLPDDSVNLCVSSPPYFGLRDYGVDGQIGLEPTPTEYVAALVDIFREVRRVLRADGNCYVNLGESYSTGSLPGANILDGLHSSIKEGILFFGARCTLTVTAHGEGVLHSDKIAPDGKLARFLGVKRVLLKQRNDHLCQVLNWLNSEVDCFVSTSVRARITHDATLEIVMDTENRVRIVAANLDDDTQSSLGVSVRPNAAHRVNVALAVKESTEPVSESITDIQPARDALALNTPSEGVLNIDAIDDPVTFSDGLALDTSGLRDFSVSKATDKHLHLSLMNGIVSLEIGCVPHLLISNAYGSLVRYKELYAQASALANELQAKQEIGIPEMFKRAMMRANWICRETIIWAKPAPMPESVTDRCTRAHEYIFHFTKQARYWYDQQAVSEESTGNMNGGRQRAALRGTFDYADSDFKTRHVGNGHNGLGKSAISDTRNRRSVWTVNTAGFAEAHFATFPEKLVEPMVLAGCPEWVCERCGAPYEAQVEKESNWEAQKANGATGGAKTNGHNGTHGRGMSHDLGGGAVTHYGYAPSCTCNAGKRAGVVLDPFAGAGTTALVAKRLNRRYIGCDLNAEYVEMARRRVESIPYTLFSLMGAD